jgi:hypothetical protein
MLRRSALSRQATESLVMHSDVLRSSAHFAVSHSVMRGALGRSASSGTRIFQKLLDTSQMADIAVEFLGLKNLLPKVREPSWSESKGPERSPPASAEVRRSPVGGHHLFFRSPEVQHWVKGRPPGRLSCRSAYIQRASNSTRILPRDIRQSAPSTTPWVR